VNIKEYHLSQNSEATPHFSEDSPSLPAFSPEIKTTTAITSLHTGQGLPMLDYHKPSVIHFPSHQKFTVPFMQNNKINNDFSLQYG